MFGVGLSEDALQERCFMLNKWMQAVFAMYEVFPPEAQTVLSRFLSLDDDSDIKIANEVEANKELILSLLRRRHERSLLQQGLLPKPPLASVNSTHQAQAAPLSPSSQTSTPAKDKESKAAASDGKDIAKVQSPGNLTAQSSANGPQIRPNFSRVQSVYSEAPGPQLSGDQLAEYSRETAVGGELLGVSVLRGEDIPKKGSGSGLHPAYEVCSRERSVLVNKPAVYTVVYHRCCAVVHWKGRDVCL